MNSVPNEILQIIFGFLRWKDLPRVARTCKRYNNLIKNDTKNIIWYNSADEIYKYGFRFLKITSKFFGSGRAKWIRYICKKLMKDIKKAETIAYHLCTDKEDIKILNRVFSKFNITLPSDTWQIEFNKSTTGTYRLNFKTPPWIIHTSIIDKDVFEESLQNCGIICNNLTVGKC